MVLVMRGRGYGIAAMRGDGARGWGRLRVTDAFVSHSSGLHVGQAATLHTDVQPPLLLGNTRWLGGGGDGGGKSCTYLYMHLSLCVSACV